MSTESNNPFEASQVVEPREKIALKWVNMFVIAIILTILFLMTARYFNTLATGVRN